MFQMVLSGKLGCCSDTNILPLPTLIDLCSLILKRITTLNTAFQGGLYEKWSEEQLRLAQQKSHGLDQELETVDIGSGDDGSFTALTVVHLQGAFMALLIGFLASSIIEVYEFLLIHLSCRE